MKVEPNQSIEAVAVDLGNGKERIEVNGETLVKAAKAGTWTHLVRVTYQAQSSEARGLDFGKCKSREAAESWTARDMFDEYLTVKSAKAAKERGESLEKTKDRYGHFVWRAHFGNVKREIFEIKR